MGFLGPAKQTDIPHNHPHNQLTWKYHQEWRQHHPKNCLLCLHCLHCLHCIHCSYGLRCLLCLFIFSLITLLTLLTLLRLLTPLTWLHCLNKQWVFVLRSKVGVYLTWLDYPLECHDKRAPPVPETWESPGRWQTCVSSPGPKQDPSPRCSPGYTMLGFRIPSIRGSFNLNVLLNPLLTNCLWPWAGSSCRSVKTKHYY